MDVQALAYNFIRRVFPQETRSRLKGVRHRLQRKAAPLYKARYGTFTAEQLFDELSAKLPPSFDVLMVHSSSNALFPMYQGTMPEMLKMLVELCKPDRTLAMPAFFFGDDRYHYDMARYFSEHPVFHVKRTLSQMGLLTEVFKRYPGVMRSLHPTHRITALGPKAEELVAGHERCRTGCGAGSPFDKMAQWNTVILGIGVKYFHCMTQSHSAEDLLIEREKYPTRFEVTPVEVTLVNEQEERFPYTLNVLDMSPYQRKIHPLVRNLLSDEELHEWRFHGVPMFYSFANRVNQVLIEAALKGNSAYHPL